MEIRKFRPDIEGLRAISVLMVLISHVGLGLPGGFVGVDIFFVISGFLITQNLFKEAVDNQTVSLKKFYARRILRIFPDSLTVLLFTLFGASIWLSPLRLTEYAKDALFSAVSFVNYHFAINETDYFNSATVPSPFQHYWSLAVEEQFYFLWPLLILIFVKLIKTKTLKQKIFFQAILTLFLLEVIAYSLFLSYSITPVSQPWAYFGLHTRAWEIALGAILAVNVNWLAKVPKFLAFIFSWTGFAGIITSLVLISDTTPFPGLWALLPTLSVSLMILAGINKVEYSAESWLKFESLQWLGKISFSLYLVHWPIFIIGKYGILDGRELLWKEKMVFIIVSILSAHFLSAILENPIRFSVSLKKSLKRTYSVGFALILISVLTSGGVWVWKENQQSNIVLSEVTMSENENQVIEKVKLALNTQTLPDNLYNSLGLASKDKYSGCIDTETTTEPTEKGICKLGDTNSKKIIILLGDSHAHQWTEAIDQIAKKNGYKLLTYTRSACPLSNITHYDEKLKREYTECYSWREKALQEITKIRPEYIITTNVVWAKSTEKTYSDYLSKLQKISKQVIKISDTPSSEYDTLDCLSKNPKNMSKCVFNLKQGSYSTNRVDEMKIARDLNISTVDVIPFLCHENTCPPMIDNVLVYRDKSHISNSYAKYLTNLLDEKMNLDKIEKSVNSVIN